MPSTTPENTSDKYYPPTRDTLVRFAETVGNEMGEGFQEYEIVQGLADFMSVIARALANNLNRKRRGEFDNAAE